MKEKLTVIKVGGKIVEEPDTLNQLLDDFHLCLAIRCWCMEEAALPLVLLHNWELKARW